MLSFQLAFSLSSFTFIKRLFSSSSLYAIRVVSSAYLWLIFLLEILIQACDSSSPGFWWCIFIHVNWKVKIYSLVVLRSNFDPVHCSMFGSNCCFLTYIQVSQETGKVVWYSHLSLRIFHSLLWSTQLKAFGVINKAEVDVFLELSCFFDDSADVGNLISGSFAFSKSSLVIWNFLVHIH